MPNRPGNDDRITATGSDNDAGNDDFRQNAGQGSSHGGSSARSRSNRGFASMDRGKQREIASKGGKAAHAKGTAHEFDSSEAREAGRKGGVAVSRNRDHMATIGRRGGEARGHARARTGVGAQSNTGSSRSLEGSFQNSRNLDSDREVTFDNRNEGGNIAGGANQGSRAAFGDRHSGNESFGNR